LGSPFDETLETFLLFFVLQSGIKFTYAKSVVSLQRGNAQRCDLVLQRCNIVASQMMPPISAYATSL
jgi:hypothetical protein